MGGTWKNGPIEDAQKFYKLMVEGLEELYPGCKNFTKISFVIRNFLIRILHGWSNGAIEAILRFIKEIVTKAVPKNFKQSRKDEGIGSCV